jgi:hypothetical protein
MSYLSYNNNHNFHHSTKSKGKCGNKIRRNSEEGINLACQICFLSKAGVVSIFGCEKSMGLEYIKKRKERWKGQNALHAIISPPPCISARWLPMHVFVTVNKAQGYLVTIHDAPYMISDDPS